MDRPLLVAQGLDKHFGETHALRDVSLEISTGQVHAILGENGSGKSTLGKIIAGIIPPDSGELTIGGQRVRTFSPPSMLELGVAIVLQEVLVALNRSVVDNVLLGRDTPFRFRYSNGERREIVSDILQKLTRRTFDLDQMVGELELQEQQILVIARGLLCEPKLLILDEATAALDLADRDMLFSTIRQFVSDGGTVAFVSHRLPEVLELSDVVHVMHNGHNTARLEGEDLNPKTLLAHLTQEFEGD